MFSAESHMKIICGFWWFHDRLNIWLSTCTSGYLPTSTLCVPSGIVYSMDWEDPLEKGMATHSSILAWRIPGMGKPGGLPSMGSHRVGHNWNDLAAAAAAAAALGLSCDIQDLWSSLRHNESLVAACKLFVPGQNLVPQLGMELRTFALGEQSLSHWTTREVPCAPLLGNRE